MNLTESPAEAAARQYRRAADTRQSYASILLTTGQRDEALLHIEFAVMLNDAADDEDRLEHGFVPPEDCE